MREEINELRKELSLQASELAELRKASEMMITDDYPTSMGVTYTTELQSKVFENAPYYRFLENAGRFNEVGTANVAFYKETDNSTIEFIAEDGDIPDAVASKYEEVARRMKTLVYPIDIGVMAQMGNDTIDLTAREIEKGYIKMANTVDNELLNGANTGNGFPGIITEINGATGADKNVTTLGASEGLTTDVINEMFIKLVDDQGSVPSVIVTSYKVAILLQKLVKKEFDLTVNDKVDIGLGHRVNVFNAVTGAEIPIIVDKNMPQNGGKEQMLIIDANTVEVKRLMAPTMFQNLPTNKLGKRDALVTFLTQQNTGIFKNGLITGIDTSILPTNVSDDSP